MEVYLISFFQGNLPIKNMTTWTSQLTALTDHATVTGNTLSDYVSQGICVGLEQDGVVINTASITTLKAVGVVLTTDGVHLGLSPLGFGFMQTMLANA